MKIHEGDRFTIKVGDDGGWDDTDVVVTGMGAGMIILAYEDGQRQAVPRKTFERNIIPCLHCGQKAGLDYRRYCAGCGERGVM